MGFPLKRLYNDLQKEMGLFQIRQGQKSVVVGDVGDPAIVATLHSACQSPALVSGGFSCQPCSALGDKGKSGDPRSGSLVKLLSLAFWLRAHSVILECVSEAGEDQEVQNIIARFCKLTGFNQSQAVLHLESIVPARRTRWWCMLSNASVPGFCIRPLPGSACLGHLSNFPPMGPSRFDSIGIGPLGGQQVHGVWGTV